MKETTFKNKDEVINALNGKTYREIRKILTPNDGYNWVKNDYDWAKDGWTKPKTTPIPGGVLCTVVGVDDPYPSTSSPHFGSVAITFYINGNQCEQLFRVKIGIFPTYKILEGGRCINSKSRYRKSII